MAKKDDLIKKAGEMSIVLNGSETVPMLEKAIADAELKLPRSLVITQEFLDANPEFTALNAELKVGDEIEYTVEDNLVIPAEEEAPSNTPGAANVPGAAALANTGKATPTAIIRGGEEFVRVYDADFDQKLVKGFLSKDPSYSALNADTIDTLVVSYDAEEVNENTGEKKYTRAEKRFSRSDHGDDMFSESIIFKNEVRGIVKVLSFVK